MAGFFGPFAGPRGHHGDEPGWPQPPFGRAWRGFGRKAERLFDRGDMKYVVLDLLRERPRHGYDVIRALEERFQGLYSPSAGTVYPTLQLLEDQGYVSSDQVDGKRVYTLTDEGRKFLGERASTLEGIRSRITAGWGGGHGEMHALMGELRDLGKTLFQVASRGGFEDPERVRRLRAVVARARGEIEAILSGEPEPVREV
jgi:DNA-binding PadR family transcriptional regulator